MNKTIFFIILLLLLIFHAPAFALETAPRISDKEIVERLTRLEEGQKRFEASLKSLDKGLNKRIDDLRSEINSRFDTLQWMLGLFITLAFVILGFILRLMWQMHRRQTQVETTLETQKDELTFLKKLIEKLLPPKGVL